MTTMTIGILDEMGFKKSSNPGAWQSRIRIQTLPKNGIKGLHGASRLALVAYVRHNYTNYEELIREFPDAYFLIKQEVNWQVCVKLDEIYGRV